MAYEKPLPVPDPESAPFWEGCRAGKLMMQRAPSTGIFQFPPTTFCPGGLERPEWAEVSGLGRIFSWIVIRHPIPADVYADDVPYVVALVDLDEGVRMAANIRGCAVDAVSAGMRVVVDFDAVTEEVTLPYFRPAMP